MMTGDHIAVPGHLLGDRFIVVLRRRDPAPGDTAVARIGDDVMLRRYFIEGDLIRLEAANRRIDPLRLPPSHIEIHGIVVGLMRRFLRASPQHGAAS